MARLALRGEDPDPADAVAEDLRRVVVVGAGIAGLAAANALATAGVETVVLEARHRIGGRLHTVRVGETSVDLGGAWIHEPIGNPLSLIADRMGLPRLPGNFWHEAVLWDERTGPVDPPLAVRLVAEADAFLTAHERRGLELRAGAPMMEVIDRYVDHADGFTGPAARGRLRALLVTMVEQDGGARAGDVSHGSWPAASGSYAGDYLGDLPVGGYQRLVRGLASGLDIRPESPVSEIAVDGNRVRVVDRDGTVHRGSHAVVTLPLGVLKADLVRFDPPLSSSRRDAVQRLGFGRFEKLALRFEAPFWSSAGFPHVVPLATAGGPLPAVLMGLDRVVGTPVLVALAFGSGLDAISAGSDRDAVRRILDLLEAVVGAPAPVPLGWVRTSWSDDRFSRGAYAFVRRGSERAMLDELGRPQGGRILFAGEATSSRRVGYADGALNSGIREARRLLRRPEVELALAEA